MNFFLRPYARWRERKREEERYRQMVQDCVPMAVKLKNQIDQIARQIEAGRYYDPDFGLRMIARRNRALKRIAKIQCAAWRKGFRTEPPYILQRAVVKIEAERG